MIISFSIKIIKMIVLSPRIEKGVYSLHHGTLCLHCESLKLVNDLNIVR